MSRPSRSWRPPVPRSRTQPTADILRRAHRQHSSPGITIFLVEALQNLKPQIRARLLGQLRQLGLGSNRGILNGLVEGLRNPFPPGLQKRL